MNLIATSLALGLIATAPAFCQTGIYHDPERKLVTLTDGQGDLALRLNYDGRCILDQITIRGRQVAGASGVCTGLRSHSQWFTSRNIANPSVTVAKNTLTVTGIAFGQPGAQIHETWRFTVMPDQIVWRISRRYPGSALLDDLAFPEWDFANLSTWTGGLLDNGGVVWNKYLDQPNATYGAHFGAVTFWNTQSNDCLRITPRLPPGQFGAGRFSRQTNGAFSFDYAISPEELAPKHELRRFLRNRQDLWAPFHVNGSTVSAEFTLKTMDYSSTYDRGAFSGVDGGQVRDLLNTVARYGVIDQRLTGGNGWRSGYVCLHEPFFAEMALALDQDDYTANFARCLDFERDHALGADGRVKSRWAYGPGDSMRGTFDSSGFYEAQWGWLMDSQPDYVINVAELFNLTGDRAWLAGQKAACEKALNFLIRRQVGDTGLVAMMNDYTRQHKSSDWIDIIWASYENAFVNAQFYYALELWADAEDSLHDPARAASYRDFAARLKSTFNRPISEGGFWDPANQWYVYWRDKDGSIHGNNLVTPVNFAAIAYGLCDDNSRRKLILDRIELEMRRERLFTWPLNVFPYPTAEGGGGNFPFPRYENGDLFLSWNELAVRAYAVYDPQIALKYVKSILDRYARDGLSFQRYLRKSQNGAGDDILAGNCMAVVGLYRDLYGLQPKPNRLYLEPHLPAELSGARLRYQLRGQVYIADLRTNACAITAGGFTLRDDQPFAINATSDRLEFFPGQNPFCAMSISGRPLTVSIDNWPDNPDASRQWTETAPPPNGKMFHRVHNLRPGAAYQLNVNSRPILSLRADHAGDIKFTCARDSLPQKFELIPSR